MTQLPSRSARSSDRVPANTSKPCLQPLTKPTQRTPKPAKKTQQHPSKEHKKPNTAERNIDKVVFGNICFSTWYHSPYGTEALGDVSGNSVKSGNSNGPSSQDGNGKDDGPGNATSRKTKEDKLDRLYVCPCCFKYSKELVPWWQHVHQCERRGYVPGEKIYTHPKGQHAGHAVPPDGAGAAPKGTVRKRRAPDTAAQPAEEPVEDQGEWSIWEVDGEEEGLFCQNLSLFAKLFLDNKSVFFDVIGFKYYLLVHTAPRPPQEPSPQGTTDKGDEEEAAQPLPLPLKHQIVGFFSKEKLSWDNNNLACILIFPPWQRKGLGALLMGVSYEISRREGVVGGPEKPISDLGKRGYKRFWAGKIAAWLLGLDTTGDEEVVVDAEQCSQATWIVPEDCLAVLREMGVVEEAGLGPPKPVRRGTSPGDGDGGEETAAVPSGDKEKEVPRVRISKEAVWQWIRANSISLEKACDPDGFVEGYAIKTESVEADEE
jgi:GNAT superfamily N-acetyltransferase